MFDPTAFENMKVVIEGHLYDMDLDGKLQIIDRDDLINMAKLSRSYSIHFRLKDSVLNAKATFCLQAKLENLAAELMSVGEEARQGCIVKIYFDVKHPNREDYFHKIQDEFESKWGLNRNIQQNIGMNPLSKNANVINRITIDFNRLIREDHIDDLLEMVDYVVETLNWLDNLEV